LTGEGFGEEAKPAGRKSLESLGQPVLLSTLQQVLSHRRGKAERLKSLGGEKAPVRFERV